MEHYGRRSRLSDVGITLAILLTIGVFAYAAMQIYDASQGLVGGLFKSSSNRPQITLSPEEPAAQPSAPAAAPAEAQPQPTAAPQPTPNPQNMKIANTGGDGVYLRKTPNMNDRLMAWPDNTRVAIVGEDVVADGITWKKVRDPRGNVGFIPSQFLAPAQ